MKYIVRLSDAERQSAEEVVKRLKGTSQKVRRAQILLHPSPVRFLIVHPSHPKAIVINGLT